MCCRMRRRPAGARPFSASFRANGSITSNTAATSCSSRASAALFARLSAMTKQPLGGERLQEDRAAGRDLVVAVGGKLDDGGLLLLARELADGARPERAQDLVLLQRRQADERHDAVAEHGREPGVARAGPEGEGSRGQHVAALQARGVDAVADQQRAGDDPRSGLGESSG